MIRSPYALAALAAALLCSPALAQQPGSTASDGSQAWYTFTGQLNASRGRSLVRMVTDVGHAIDLDIVAEGVETDEELELLRLLGADQLQGYHLSRPLPLDALEAWVRRRAGAVHLPA